MLLTSREQALLSIAVDRIFANSSEIANNKTFEMWTELYDAVIGADIDDVGEEYDPEMDDEDYDVLGDFYADLSNEDLASSFAYSLTDEAAGYVFAALFDRMDREDSGDTPLKAACDAYANWEPAKTQARDVPTDVHPDQIDLEDAIKAVRGLNVEVDTGKDRYNRFSDKVEVVNLNNYDFTKEGDYERFVADSDAAADAAHARDAAKSKSLKGAWNPDGEAA